MRIAKLLTLSLIGIFLSLSIVQAQTKDERKKAKKDLKKRAIKDARKEAKRWKKKRGYTNIIGDLPMEKQLENAFLLNYVMDDKGRKKYYVASQEAKAETFAAAKQQAQQLCLADIASQIGSNILGRIKSNIANNESIEDAASVTEVVGAYQNTVAAKLGRTEPIVIFKKVDKLTHIAMMMKYDMSSAEEMIKEDLRQELKKKTELLQDEIDGLLDLK